MIFVRPFKKEDFKAFTPIELGWQEFKCPEMIQAIEDSDLAVTGLKDDIPVGCGGVHPIDDFLGEIWLRLSDECLKNKLDTLQWIREGLKIIEDTFPFKQLNATIRKDFRPSIKLVEFLGFKKVQEKDNWYIYSKRVKE